MTDRELAEAAWLELTKTTDAYPTWKRKGFPSGSHWAKAKGYLDMIGRNVVAPSAVPLSSSSGLLFYRPPGWNGGNPQSSSSYPGYTVYNVPSTGSQSITLSAGTDYFINLGDRQWPVEFTGGRNLVMIGGQVTARTPAQSSDSNEWRAIQFHDQTGTVHVEGVRIPFAAMGFVLDCVGATVQLQNILLDLIDTDYAIMHADAIITWRSPSVIRIHRLTGYRSQYAKGWLFTADPRTAGATTNFVGSYTATCVNFRRHPDTASSSNTQNFAWDADVAGAVTGGAISGQENYTGDLGYWSYPSGPNGLQDRWGVPNGDSGIDPADLLRNLGGNYYRFIPYTIVHDGVSYDCDSWTDHDSATFSSGPVGRTDGDYIYKRQDSRYPTQPYTGAKWIKGDRPGGDWVTSASAGTAYVSPGYI